MTPRTFLMAAVATVGLATIAGAQTQPAGGQSPFWNGGNGGSGGAGGSGGSGGGAEQSSNDFPTQLALEVAPAAERYAAARAAMNQVREQMDERLDQLRTEFEESSEYQSAADEQKASYIARDEARRGALVVLASDDDYNAARMLKDRLEREIRRAHDSGEVSQRKILGMSELALSYGEQIAEAEGRLLDTDPAVIDARNRVRLANEKISQLERGYEQGVRDDEALDVLRSELRQLTIATEAAYARYASAVRSANIAADYAYTRTFQQNRGGYGYGYNYGYNYGYPYYGFPFYGYGNFTRTDSTGVIRGGSGGSGGSGGGVVGGDPIVIPPRISNVAGSISQQPDVGRGSTGD